MAQTIGQNSKQEEEGGLVDNTADVVEPIDTEIGGKVKRKRDGSALRKAPQAPKRFKSSYIMFFMAKQQEIKAELGAGTSVGDVSKESSERWKKLSSEDRAIWDKKAMEDKERYNLEKASYTGPWQVPWKRAKKDPKAPKRPMSAFLFFSQDKRRKIKAENPGMRNTEISRVLGEMWKEAAEEEKKIHIEREAKERAKYKVDIAKWREEDLIRKEDENKEQIEQAKLATQCYSSHNSPPSNTTGVDDSQSYSSQHSFPSQKPSQSCNAQQYYQESYGYHDYHGPSSQGYRQNCQYYDNFTQEEGPNAYYNSSALDHYSQYQQKDGPFMCDPSLSQYSTNSRTGGELLQYPNSEAESAYYAQPPQDMHSYHYNPNHVTSHQGDVDDYNNHYSSQIPSHDASNFSSYR